MTLADVLALLRALSVIPIWYALMFDLRATAFAFFAFAALTDAVDGWLARRRATPTLHGAVLDPIADKVLVLGTAAALVVSGLEAGPNIDPLLFGLLVVLELTSAVIRLDEYRRRVSRPADAIGKAAKTAAQMVALAVLIVVRPPEALGVGAHSLLWIAVIFGLVSLAQRWPHRRRPAL
jgi:CDP-diacylglycerol--glycerol-3-phosphate 3-phosphatidyltransferase